MADRFISLRGVEVHNLKGINLDIPRRQLVVLCGLSGSGKTSLAIDTLYAEGQRRYIESFSAYTRQFLQRLEKPAAERIDGIPPAIAVSHKNTSRSARSTIGTTTETNDYLRLLWAKIGRLFCVECGREVRRDSSQSTAAALQLLPSGTRFLVLFRPTGVNDRPVTAAEIRELGYVRILAADRLMHLEELSAAAATIGDHLARGQVQVVVDRLTATTTAPQRVREALEAAFARGAGQCQVLVDLPGSADVAGLPQGHAREVDGRTWREFSFSERLRCEDCGRDYPPLEPRLFSFNSPLGACPHCEGFGNVMDIDMDLVVPDPNKSIREGAIVAWSTPAYAHEQAELIALARDVGLPLDLPFNKLAERHLAIIRDGSPRHKFGGLRGFFAWLDKHKYKVQVRVFLSRWRSARVCPECHGARLRPEALAVRIGGKNLAEVSRLKVDEARRFFVEIRLADFERELAHMMLDQVKARLGFLAQVGLDYITLDRTLRTLSGGESQRVALTSALGSSLVNMLYVLDEPSVGLHPRDTQRLIGAIAGLRDRGNSVVVVEHEEAMIEAADQIIEIGPGAGERGGEVVYQGSPAGLLTAPRSITGDFLSGRRGVLTYVKRREPRQGWIRLTDARGNNLKNVTAEFPLGVLCLVTGVSGSGKSTLVGDTLYPALKRRLREEAPRPEPYGDVFGDGQIDEVLLVDQSPIGRSPRSNPVTYIKAFDEIRAVFADTVEAHTHNFTAGHFSFNVDGGRCPACEGDGYIEIDMQFLADVFMKCGQCHGQRYRKEILKVRYRGRNMAEVLEMTAREAFTFFRGCRKVQERLKRLIDVGLDYLRLGQPANTLSGGESQRLKLAGYLSGAKRRRTLFILDEPTTGLHFADVVQLTDCFEALLAVGHSLIIVEHNLQLMKAADYLIDLGPGAAEKGGQIVARGTPEEVARNPASHTGRYLAEVLARDAARVELAATESR